MIVPLVSPFTDDTSSLSEVRHARIVRFHRERGAGGFVVGSMAGETFGVSLAERKQLLEWTVRESHGLPVYVDVTAMTTAATLDLAQHAERHGARAALFTVGPGLHLTPQESHAYMAAVYRHGNLPCAFLGPHAAPTDGVSSFKVQAIEDEWTLEKGLSTEEFAHSGDTASPLGVLGPDLAKRAILKWPDVHAKLRALFQHYGPHRVGKAALGCLGIEAGHLRGPVQDMDAKGQEVLTSVIDELIAA
jgi:dihydrodipicolinate synthase/N-acetylneuraminate lyase